jgi:Na+-translocating ferredoxin:NAD+ oxidoreductase subunit A
MTSFTGLVEISIGAVLINNFVLSRFIGLCPFFGVSNKISNAFGMGIAVIFVMSIASMCTWLFDHYILLPYKVGYLHTLMFILVIASCVQFVEMVLQKYSRRLYESLGIYLPLITTNCAVLGIALINAGTNPMTGAPFTFVESLVNAIMSGAGFLLALLLMAGIRDRLEVVNIPKALQGLPISFIIAGLMALAFLGFSGFHFF